MASGTLLYAQSGGVTAVINASASAVIQAARARKVKVLAARNGILGALREELIDTSKESMAAIRALAHTPGGAFGSCRLKLKSLEQDRAKYERLLEVFRAHDVRWFLYNGGNDSADTALKVSQLAKEFGYPLTCVGVPKTVDNDLAVTDCCPGFGSAAKYTAVSVAEAALDVAAMADTSTKVFVYEVMGRHAGWLAAAAGLAGQGKDEAPHIILFPEVAYDEAKFLARVQAVVKRVGHCVVVVSEGLRHAGDAFHALRHALAGAALFARGGGFWSLLAARAIIIEGPVLLHDQQQMFGGVLPLALDIADLRELEPRLVVVWVERQRLFECHRIAEFARFFQIVEVTGVQQVKNAVREH